MRGTIVAMILVLGATTGCKKAAPSAANVCLLRGEYEHNTESVGSAKLAFTSQSDGTYSVKESGLGSFTGKGKIEDGVLSVDFQTDNGYSGVYTWKLDADCTHGTGQLVFRTGGSGTHASKLSRLGSAAQ